MCGYMCTSVPSSSQEERVQNKMYTSGNIANSQRTQTEINKDSGKIKDFNGTSDTIRHLKTIR